jgi:uncharacterized membrane protein YhaH (DUF805 family)
MALLSIALTLTTISVALLATGGFTASVFGVRVSAHSPLPSAAGAALALSVWLVVAWRAKAVSADLSRLHAWIERHARAIVLTIAALSGAAAVFFGTFSAAGSDASGYLSQAAMLSADRLSREEPLAAIANWPDARTSLAPLGWRAGAGTTQVPTYAVGLPLLMTIPHALGGAIAASLVVSVSAALAVWCAARLAMLLAGGTAAVLAAVWIATLPVHIYESIQPMSDVPVTAAWLACWLWIAKPAALRQAQSRPERSRGAEKGTVPFMAVFASLAGAIAVVIRPNLAPLAAMPCLYLIVRAPHAKAIAAASFAAPVAAAGVLIAYLQWRYFGSAFNSGYGSASEIYSLANVVPNAALYFRWLVDTHGPWLLAAPAALFVTRASILRWMIAFAALVCFAYFVYSIFEHWSYLRFLLPAMAIAAVAVAVLVVSASRRLPAAAQAPVCLAIVLALGASNIASARELGVFRLAARQSRAMLAGRYLASVLPPHAVVISGEQSGSIRYYTGQSIVRWDFLAADSLPHVTEQLVASGYDVWIALDDWEVPTYREKFAPLATAGLDWPPAVDAGIDGRTQAWRLRDRAPFLTGARVLTDRLR